MAAIDYSGQTLDGRYRIAHLLGKGGMGSVYLAQHNVIGKRVAVKFLHAEFAAKEDVVKRFYREAQTAAAIAHKNIIDVMDVGVSPHNEPYLVMEYLEGESLSALLKRTGPIDLPAACAILEPVLTALAAAHEKGVVHRDLKPENIFLVHLPDEPPTVKIIDFGISKITGQSGESQLTQTGSMLGTPAYMPPEQVRGEKTLDHRADLYAVGVILYEMLTGQLPFRGEHYNQLLISVLTDEPVPPKTSFEGFPLEAEPLLMQLLSKNPDERPQTAAELLDRVKALASAESREDHLSQYTSGITNKSFAGGDLGSEIGSGSGQVASDILSDLVGKPTPGEWAGTVARPKKWLGAMGVAAGVGVLAVVAVLLWPKAEAPIPVTVPPLVPPVSEVPVASQSASPQGVEIAVTGIPENATIYFGEAKMPKNPFTVPSSKTMMQLKVSAPGYEDFLRWLEPSRDQTVTAELVPMTKTASASEAPKKKKRAKKKVARSETKEPEKKPEKTPKTPTAPKVEITKKPNQKLRQGGRGTKFTETFDD